VVRASNARWRYRGEAVTADTTRARWMLRAALVLATSSGCAVATTPHDVGSDAPIVDGGRDVGDPDAGCDVSPAPSPLPAFHADFQLDDAASGTSVPTMTGGDPVGVWVFDHGTFWVGIDANAMFNRYASSVAGTAWIAIDATDFRLEYDFVTTLAGTAAGTLVQPSTTRAHARWRLDREQIEPTGLVCQESNQMAYADPGRVTFTRTGDHLTLLTVVPMATGATILQLEGTLVR
jgi:hypothetical protein